MGGVPSAVVKIYHVPGGREKGGKVTQGTAISGHGGGNASDHRMTVI